MASIDKTYVNAKQWLEAKQFLQENHEQIMRELGSTINLYYSEPPEQDTEFVLWNTSEITDVWLWKNCPLEFIKQRLQQQYDTEWLELFATNMTFEDGNCAYLVELNELQFISSTDEDEVSIFDSTDTIVVYGDSSFLEDIEVYVNLIQDGFITHKPTRNPYYLIYLCGMTISYHDGSFYNETNKKIDSIPNGIKVNLPSIKYTFNSADAVGVVPTNLIFSNNGEYSSLADFKNYEKYYSPYSELIQNSIKSGRFNNKFYRFVK